MADCKICEIKMYAKINCYTVTKFVVVSMVSSWYVIYDSQNILNKSE